MAFYKLTKGQAQQITARVGHKEKDVQDTAEKNLETFFAVRFVQSEFPTGAKHRGRIDTLGLDQDGSPVIIEYKRRTNDTVINQGLFYLDWLMDHRGDFELAVQKALGPKVEVSWGQPRLILLAEGFNRYDQYAVNRIDERIELWTYTFYVDEFLRVERLDTEEVTTENKEPSKTVPKVRAKRGQGYDLNHHVSKMGADTKALFDLLREQVLALGDDVTERFMNQYVGYRRQKNFTEIVGLKNSLNIFIDGPVQDFDGIGEDVTNVGHWGTGNLRVKATTDDDIEQVLKLIEQAYKLQQ